MLRQMSESLTLGASRAGLQEFTTSVQSWVAGTGIRDGLLTLFCRHTSASLLIQENAAGAVQHDLELYFARLAPESRDYEHDDEGPDDMPAHLRTALTQTHLSIPIKDGRMMLGTWQGIFLFEHRRSTPGRQVVLHLVGE